MAFDALSLSLILKEQRALLIGGKINRVSMPEKDEVVLTVFNKKTYKLLFSCNNNVNRILLTEQEAANPLTAPTFCMLLRKYLLNGTISDVNQQPFERVADFLITTKNDLGYTGEIHLIFELTGRDSNLILTDSNYKIIDSLRHFSCDLQSARIILPNATYRFFPPQIDKLLPTDTEKIDFFAGSYADQRQFLSEKVLGICPTTANEVYSLANHNDVSIGQAMQLYLNKLDNAPRPNVVYSGKTPSDVFPFEYLSRKGEKVFFETLNKAHDFFYSERNKTQRFAEKTKSISTNLKNAIARTEKKLGIQRQAILDAQGNVESKLYGDLILANLHLIKKNDESVTVVNYYDEQCPTVVIPLDVRLSPQQNSQAYYKKYAKLKSSLKHNTQLVEENERLLEYLKGVAKNLTFCETDDDIAEIAKELTDKKIIKNKPGNSENKKQQNHTTKPLHYNIDGFDIYVGKNNIQNDFVTFKIADSHDLWLHTQKIHSSHAVIIKQKGEIPDDVIVKTAEIVAHYSQASAGSKIAVDYCLKKFVKKPSGAVSGFVVYTDFYTVLVDPDPHKEYLIK